MGYGEKGNTIGDWSIDKLSFLERYLPCFARATKKARHKYYIDGFAGNGEWIHRITGEQVPGSVNIALNYVADFTEMHFIEMDEERVQNLNKLVKSYHANNKAFVHKGDCNILLQSIIKPIHPKSPIFIFLDPSSDQLNWNTIKVLSKWQTELFILYPYHMTIQRYLPQDKKIRQWQIDRLNNFFGTDEWYSIYLNRPRMYLLFELLDLYTTRLKEIGYNYCNISNCFKTNTGQNLYYMIWVGKHPVGKKIMDSVFKQQDSQLSFDL